MDFELIRQLRARRATAAAELEALDARISTLIKQAIDDGHGPTEIARELGITRARVYQIIGR